MTESVWEDFISLNSRAAVLTDTLEAASRYAHQDDGTVRWDLQRLPLAEALKRDGAPLPKTEDREGYYGDNHFNYWASGLRDYCELVEWTERHGVPVESYLDFGCASGRIVRAFQAQSNIKVYGCDINRKHVDWIAYNLPKELTVFQNTSIPSLPMRDGSLDLITAFSVFTHVETFDTTWLMEFERLLRPGGLAWLTIHGDRTWRELKPDWPLYAPLAPHPDYQKDQGSPVIPRPRSVYRWHHERSYSANVFYTYDYIRTVWGRILDVVDIRPGLPAYQDVIVLQKPK